MCKFTHDVLLHQYVLFLSILPDEPTTSDNLRGGAPPSPAVLPAAVRAPPRAPAALRPRRLAAPLRHVPHAF